MFIGNQKIASHFDVLLKNKAFSQAYCLVGPRHIGKRTLVNQVATTLLGAKDATIHPDYFYLGLGVDEKTGTPKTEIGVAEARKLRAALSLKSLSGEYRVTIVDDAELMSTEAANALLKIVEEPPEKTIIFFLADRIENIPETIRSRTEVFYFALARASEIEQGLAVRGVDQQKAAHVAAHAWGRPGRAIKLAEDNDYFDNELHLAGLFERMLEAPVGERLNAVEALTEKKDGARVSEEVIKVIDTWLMAARAKLMSGHEPVVLPGIIDSLHEAKSMLRQNVNTRLVLENIFLKK